MSASKFTPIVWFLCCLLLLAPMVGAGQSENTKQAAGKAAKAAKAAKAESCDGAADIVPAKPVSFARKRRPAPKSQAAESKPAKTQ